MGFQRDCASALEAATHVWAAYAPCGCRVAQVFDLVDTRELARQTRAAVAELEAVPGRTVRREPRPAGAGELGCRCAPEGRRLELCPGLVDRRPPRRSPAPAARRAVA